MLKVYFSAVAVLITCHLFGSALAQENVKTQANGQKGTEGAAAARTLSIEEQVAEGKTIVASGERLSTRVSNMLEGARKEADIIRITCLNEKLTQINANLRNAQKRLESLTGAVDSDRRNHEYAVLTVLGQKLQTLDQESNQCVGQDIFETGATRVETDIDTSVVPPENPLIIIPPPMGVVPPPAIPPPASPNT